jgi:hypothetical protein
MGFAEEINFSRLTKKSQKPSVCRKDFKKAR